MWNDTETREARNSAAARFGWRGMLHRLTPLVLLGALLGALVAVPLTAQGQPAPAASQGSAAVRQEAPAAGQEAPAAVQEAHAELAARISADYEVLPVRDGVVLRPKQEYRGVRAIELAGESVAINGEVVPAAAVRGWLGPRAEDILELAGMDPEARQGLFDLAAPVAPAEAAAGGASVSATPVPESPETPAVEPTAPVPPPPAPRAPRSHRGSQTGFGSNVYVAPDEVVDDVVVLGGSVTVDGRVDGDAVVVGGRLEINGTVDQNAAVIGGSMSLGPHAKVGGDVSVVGGSLDRSPGAHIGGKLEQVERNWRLGPFISSRGWSPRWHSEWRGWSPWSEIGELFWALGTLVLLGLLIAIVLAVGRGTIENISYRIGREPIKAGLVGLLIAILWMPVFIVVSALLVISIIGIPIFVILLLAFIFIGVPALLVIGLVGYTTVSHRAGLWLGERFGWHLDNAFAAALTGLVALSVLTIIGRLLSLFGGPVDFFAAMFLFVGCALQLVAGCVGFGGVFLHLWDRRSASARASAAQAPLPPIPGGGASAAAAPEPAGTWESATPPLTGEPAEEPLAEPDGETDGEPEEPPREES